MLGGFLLLWPGSFLERQCSEREEPALPKPAVKAAGPLAAGRSASRHGHTGRSVGDQPIIGERVRVTIGLRALPRLQHEDGRGRHPAMRVRLGEQAPPDRIGTRGPRGGGHEPTG